MWGVGLRCGRGFAKDIVFMTANLFSLSETLELIMQAFTLWLKINGFRNDYLQLKNAYLLPSVILLPFFSE